jgi:hypothetical protein
MAQSSFVKYAAVGVTAGAVAVLTVWLLGAFAGDGFDDEDRPPIIVNNGSIEIRALPLLGEAGSWTAVDAKYQHTHSKDGPNSFVVHVSGASEPQCRNRKFANTSRIAFTLNGVAQGFEIRIENSSLTVFAGSHPLVATGGLLTLDVAAATLQSATVHFGNTSQLCTFQDADSAVLVEQRR